MTARIFVCLTCDRYAQSPPGEITPGQRLAAAMKAIAARALNPIAVRTVECLNGCPHPCTAALRAPGKAVIRFSGLSPADAPELIEAAAKYENSRDGDLPVEVLPAGLRRKITCRVARVGAI